jgi:hypothetical protein
MGVSMFGHDDAQQNTQQNDQPATFDPSNQDGSGVPPVAPQESHDSPAPDAAAAATPSDSPTPAAVDNDELLNLKRDALSQLAPLVSHLDQTAEEKFKTTMMMIQATDDATLIKDAYEAAKQITDDKIRAQALLDIVNEINYFTQQHHAADE